MCRRQREKGTVRVFKTKWFRRFARREGIADATLCEAVARAERGVVDADLGGGVMKQRIARQGQGRSGGYRSLIVYRSGDRAVFVFAFAKSDRDDLEPDELADLKTTAALLHCCSATMWTNSIKRSTTTSYGK